MSENDLKESQLTDILTRLIDTIHRGDDVIEIVCEAIKQLSRAVKCDHVNVLFHNEPAKFFYINPALNQTDGEVGQEVIIPYHETAITEILRSQRSVIRDDLTGRGKLTPGDLKFLAEGIKSDLSTPVICKNRVFAIINLSSFESHYFTDSFQFQTEQIAALLGLALERTELIEKINRKHTDLLAWKTKFNCLYHHIDEAVAIIRLDDDLIYETNLALQKLTGYQAEELHGMRLSQFHPQQEESILSAADKCSKNQKRKTISPLNLTRKDGTKIPVRLHFVFIGGEQIQFVFAIYEDLASKNSIFFPLAEDGETNHEFTRLQLSVFCEINRLAESDLQLDAIIRVALLTIKKITAFDFAQISLFDAADENVIHHTIISDRYREYDLQQNWSVLEESDFHWYSVSQQNLKQQFDSLKNSATDTASQLRSRISTVLLTRNHCQGTLLLGSLEPNFYQKHEIEFIKQIATLIGLLIENAHLADEHKENLLRSTTRSDLTRIIETDLNIDHVLSSIVKLSADKMTAQLATVQLMENDQLTSGITASDPECNKVLLSHYDKEHIAPAILKLSEPFVTVTIPFDDLEQLQCPISKSLGECITCLAIPLKLENKIIGVLSNYWNKPFQLSPEDQLRITLIAEQASEAIRTARLYQETLYRSERLAKARDELEKFVNSASHHLRTPLASIQGFAATLLDQLKDEIPDESLSYLQKIRIKSIKLQHYLDALNELARVGQILHPLDEVKIADLVEQANKQFSDVIQQRNIKIVVAKELPTITGDRNLIQQVFFNLIEYTITDIGGTIKRPKIEISCRLGTGEDIFVIRNNGIGRRRDLEEDIFDLFNSDESQEAGETNCSLSLAIAKKIIELHDGQIWLESAEDKGSAICISLPRRKF